jgi:hypothetical protein
VLALVHSINTNSAVPLLETIVTKVRGVEFKLQTTEIKKAKSCQSLKQRQIYRVTW